ncbi:MAG: SLC13 family permease [Planctomycetes bacterium]|nr:SLC13 family permease [Planctomycetota bacterium]
MGIDALLVVGLTFGMLILLVLEKATLDALGLGLLVALIASGKILELLVPGFNAETQLIGAEEALSFLANPAVVMIAALYVVGEGLARTGALEFLARGMMRATGPRPRRMILFIGLVAGLMSAFLNNTGVVVTFIPVIVGIAQKTGIPASRLMMPLAFSCGLGGMVTLVGTSTNLLVSGVASEEFAAAPIGMFEMAPIGLAALGLGVLFLALFTKKLLPKRHSLAAMMESTGMREYVTELEIRENSPLVGRTYAEAFQDAGADLLFFVRNEEMVWPPYKDQVIRHGDVVMLRGTVENVAGLQDDLGLKLFTHTRFDPKSMQFFELAVSPHSSMIGRKVKDLHLMRDYGCAAVAVLRDGYHIRERASDLVLHPGDLVLVCGDDRAQSLIRARSDFFLLAGQHQWIVLRSLGRRALLIAAGLMAAFTTCSVTGNGDLLPYAAVTGAMAMVVGGCLRARRAYRSIDWPILLFLVGTLALGRALDNSGAAAFLANNLVSQLLDFGPIVVLSGLVILCSLLSALIFNAAVAVLLTPIAIRAAETVANFEGLSGTEGDLIARGFLLAVAFGCSICF